MFSGDCEATARRLRGHHVCAYAMIFASGKLMLRETVARAPCSVVDHVRTSRNESGTVCNTLALVFPLGAQPPRDGAHDALLSRDRARHGSRASVAPRCVTRASLPICAAGSRAPGVQRAGGDNAHGT